MTDAAANSRVTVHEIEHEVVENDTGAGRYYLSLRGKQDVGLVDYTIGDDYIDFTHTEVSPSERKRGIGGRLIHAALDDVRDTGERRVIPSCPFVAAWIEKHPDYADLLTR